MAMIDDILMMMIMLGRADRYDHRWNRAANYNERKSLQSMLFPCRCKVWSLKIFKQTHKIE